MSILIKDMEIPKDYKYVDVRIFRDGTATTSSAEHPFYKKMDVVEVPTPHGRLIDADELDIRRREQQAWQDYEHNPDNEYLEGVKDGLHEASKQLSTAMTIIEAEGT